MFHFITLGSITCSFVFLVELEKLVIMIFRYQSYDLRAGNRYSQVNQVAGPVFVPSKKQIG